LGIQSFDHEPHQLSLWQVSAVGSAAIEHQFEYDDSGHLSSTGEWGIQHDGHCRINRAIGFGIATEHRHDGFGNNIFHEANPSPVPPSAMPPSTIFPPCR
jgi:hypothetical protein